MTDLEPAAEPAVAGAGLVRAAIAGAALFAASTLLALVVRALDVIALTIALGLFVLGVATFAVSLVVAASRSRRDQLGVLAMYFLEGGVAPRPVRRTLLGAFAVEVVVAATAAAARPNTSLAFGVLAPVYGLAVAGLWGARHGHFPARSGTGPGAGGRR